MRYRALSDTGDYTFGQSQGNFLIDSPEAVGQSVLTRLRLWTEEWFLDLNEGTPYSTEVLGAGTKALYDVAIRNRILSTVNVVSIDEYESTVQPGRKLQVTARIATTFGQTTISVTP